MRMKNIINIIGGILGGMIMCIASEILIGKFVGQGISFLAFPINFILAKAIFEEGTEEEK